jgi:hypothetical protein
MSYRVQCENMYSILHASIRLSNNQMDIIVCVIVMQNHVYSICLIIINLVFSVCWTRPSSRSYESPPPRLGLSRQKTYLGPKTYEIQTKSDWGASHTCISVHRKTSWYQPPWILHRKSQHQCAGPYYDVVAHRH